MISNNGWSSLGVHSDDTGDIGPNLESVGLINQVMLVQELEPHRPGVPTLGFALDAVTASSYVTLTTDCTPVTPGTYTGYTFGSKTFVPSTSLLPVRAPRRADVLLRDTRIRRFTDAGHLRVRLALEAARKGIRAQFPWSQAGVPFSLSRQFACEGDRDEERRMTARCWWPP